MIALWFAAGVLAAAVAWKAIEPTWSQPLFQRPNYRGAAVPTAGGVGVAIATIAVAAGAAVVGSHGVRSDVAAVLVAVVGFTLLGALDDLAGDNEAKGFRGHVGALVRGRLTTGGLKLVGGVGVAAVALGVTGRSVQILAVVLVAAAANLGNLFDRAPGRVGKLSIVAFAALVIMAGANHLAGAALAVGATVGLLPFDLRERLMLGDAGANAIGAALGVAAALSIDRSPLALTVTTLVVVLLNLVSEAVSFSRVIAAVAPLRWLDQLGRAKVSA